MTPVVRGWCVPDTAAAVDTASSASDGQLVQDIAAACELHSQVQQRPVMTNYRIEPYLTHIGPHRTWTEHLDL